MSAVIKVNFNFLKANCFRSCEAQRKISFFFFFMRLMRDAIKQK